MITAAGLLLVAFAAIIWLFGSPMKFLMVRLAIVLLGGSGLAMLLSSAVILSMRYLP